MAAHDQDPVLIDCAPGLVRATLNRPDTRNAINDDVMDGLARSIETAIATGARVLVVRGADGTFCSGADLNHMTYLRDHTEHGTVQFIERLAGLFTLFESEPFVTVAAVEGFALAGGFELLLACDIVLTRADALVGDRHLQYGLLPGAGGSVRLARKTSDARARYLLLTGAMVDGKTAADWGLASFAFPPEEFDVEVERVVERLRTRSADAIAGAKQMLLRERDLELADAIEVEREIVAAYRAKSPDGREGLRAFQAKAEPDFGPRE